MGTDREALEARWAGLLSGEYGADPETKTLVLWEQWQAAGDDPRRRWEVGQKAVWWLLEELNGCARTGRMYLDAIPSDYRAAWDDGAGLGRHYRGLYYVFGNRVEEGLRRAVGMATRCRDGYALGQEVSAAVPLAEQTYLWLAGFGDCDTPALIEQAVERFERAARVLSRAVAEEFPPGADQSPPEARERGAVSPAVASPPPAPNVSPPVDPPSGPGVESVSDRMAGLAAELRRKRPPAVARASLLTLLQDRDFATVEEVAWHVHGDAETSDEAIRANVKRTNLDLEEASIPLKIRVGAGVVFKDKPPA